MKHIIDLIENKITLQAFFPFLYEDDALESSLESMTNLKQKELSRKKKMELIKNKIKTDFRCVIYMPNWLYFLQ